MIQSYFQYVTDNTIENHHSIAFVRFIEQVSGEILNLLFIYLLQKQKKKQKRNQNKKTPKSPARRMNR